MLQELAITDFAIIPSLRMQLASGLVVITGETGAGKSIMLDAIGALLGERTGPDVVRAGAQRAMVEGIFVLPWLPDALARLPDPAASSSAEDPAGWDDPRARLAMLLRDAGLEGDEGEVILAREIHASGRSVARINGRTVPVQMLARAGALLVDIHGQGAHLSLLHPEEHVHLLDRVAGTQETQRDLAAGVRTWQAARREAGALRRDERELARRADLLRFQVDEIASAEVQPDELAQLENERTLLQHAERLGEIATQAHALLAGGDTDDTPAALAALHQAGRLVADLARIDPAMQPLATQLTEARIQVEDIAATLREYRDRAEADPARLAAVEERLERLARLCRKYGATLPDVLAYGDEAARELEQIEHRDERLAELDAKLATQRVALAVQARALSRQRQMAAEELSRQMESVLDHLHMRQARFFVQIQPRPDAGGVPLNPDDPASPMVALTVQGIDRVEFLIAPNPGEPPRPLARIASGGETARLMLALKTILAHADATPTLIFDEIDSGISGITGQIVGEMLWNLARGHQVLVVTHLPQMAAFGDQHWRVAKRIEEGRTLTVATALDPAGRTLELAQMLGGLATESATRNAAELLDRAAAWKKRQDVAAGNGHAPPRSKPRRTARG